MPPNDTLPARPETLGPAAMLQSAIERGASVDAIKTLAEIYERWEAKRAEKDFTLALLTFRAACPPIFRTHDGVHKAKYAPLDKIAAVIDPILAQCGFIYTFDTELAAHEIKCVCTLHHIGGHATHSHFAAPVKADHGMTDLHATASAVSFAKRYALQQALGLVTGLRDDDGAAAGGSATITDEQRHTLEALAEEAHAGENAKFWQYLGIPKDRFADLPARDFGKAHQALLQLKARRRP